MDQVPPSKLKSSAEKEFVYKNEPVDFDAMTTDQILQHLMDTDNLAEDLDEQELYKIGDRVKQDYDIDVDSRADWEKRMEDAMGLARQIRDQKTYGGEIVANVKYPLLATASIQFQARAYGNVVKNESSFVNAKVVGQDQDQEKLKRGNRIRKHMNYQLAEEMESWEDETDTLLMVLPIEGSCFKKTYRNMVDNINVSEFIGAEHVVVNYWAKSIETAARVTHVLELTYNEYLERVNGEVWLDIGLVENEPDASTDTEKSKDRNSNDPDAPYIFLEQHRWYDMDGDGYKEPWIITVHKDTGRVVRIVPRFEPDGVMVNPRTKKIIRIKPIHYFTHYKFFPSFDGSFYGMGFGILLTPINETINTLINQLLDAGTIQNRQSGFVNRGVRITQAGASGNMMFKPGEWKNVFTAGDDIRKGIMPLPVKEPSATLFSLLGLLLEASKELASQAEVLSGEQRQPNVPATTTLALIEQGLKVFGSIYKRTHRALKKEFKKLQRLNFLFTTPEEYNNVLDLPERFSPQRDYDMKDCDVYPVSGTADVSDVQRLIKAQGLLELVGRGLNDLEIYSNYLRAMQVEDWQKYLPKEQPPDPKIEIERAKMQIEMAKVQQEERRIDLKEREVMIKDAETFYKMKKLYADALKSIAQAEAAEKGAQIQEYKAEIEGMTAVIESQQKRIEADYARQSDQGSGSQGGKASTGRGNNQGAMGPLETPSNNPGNVPPASQTA